MQAAQVGAYQSASYAFTQLASSGQEQARIAATREVPEFAKSVNATETRAAIVPTGKKDAAPQQRNASGNNEGRGKIVDLFA